MIEAILETSRNKQNLSINEREEKTGDLAGRCIVKQNSPVKAGLKAITRDGDLSTAIGIFAFGLIFAGCIHLYTARKKFNN